MKKKIPGRLIGILGIVATTLPAAAQWTKLGVKAGISVPNLEPVGKSTPVSSGYTTRLGPDATAWAEYSFSPLFSLRGGLQYSSQGGQKKGHQAVRTTVKIKQALAQYFAPDPVPDYLYGNFRTELVLNYLMIPVIGTFHFPLSPRWELYAGAGPYIGYLLRAKGIARGAGSVYKDPELQEPLPISGSLDTTGTLTDQLHRINAGAQLALGLNYRCGRHNFFLEVGGNYGFVPLQKDASDGRNRTGAVTANLGYAWVLENFRRRGGGAGR